MPVVASSLRAGVVAAGLLAVVSLPACGSPASPTASSVASVSSPGPAVSSSDPTQLTVAAGDREPKIVMTVKADATLKEDYATLADLSRSPHCTLVVAGQVTRVEPLYIDQIGYSRLTVRVTRSSAASVAKGSTITVYRDGGLIPVAQVQPDLKNADELGAPAPTLPPGGVVDFQFDGAPQSQAGDQIVAFLQPDPNPGRAGSYTPVSSVHGLLRLDTRVGRYQRLGSLAAGQQQTASTADAEGYAARR